MKAPPPVLDEWSKLAADAMAGDKTAYRVLLKDIAAFSKAYLMPRVSNHDAVEDITQEVLVSVHKSLKTYSADRPFKPWLMAIISFRKTDHLRKHYSRRQDKKTSLDTPDFIQNHVTNNPYAGEYKDIDYALSSLSGQQRDILERIKIKGYTSKEVADQMGMSVSAVKVSAHRTVKKLRDMLKNEEDK